MDSPNSHHGTPFTEDIGHPSRPVFELRPSRMFEERETCPKEYHTLPFRLRFESFGTAGRPISRNIGPILVIGYNAGHKRWDPRWLRIEDWHRVGYVID